MAWLKRNGNMIAYAIGALALVTVGYAVGLADGRDTPTPAPTSPITVTTSPPATLTAEQREERRLGCIEKELGIGNPMDWPSVCP